MWVGTAADAAAAPSAPLSQHGRWITDARGRVVMLHGVNMVYKRPPYHPSAIGFDRADARFLRREGFNTVRLGVIYKGVEPSPGRYDDRYLDRIADSGRVLGREQIFFQLDFHQDLYNERFQGEGWPDWAVQDDGLPNQPQNGFPANYLTMPALQRAFDHFWANDPGPGGVGLQDRYAAAWRHVAERFRDNDHVLGYDLLNEPWPGTAWQECAQPAGCPAFDMKLAAFVTRMLTAIRTVDPDTIVWYEPQVLFNNGSDTTLPDFGDANAGMSFHDYCLTANEGGGGYGEECRTSDALVMDNALKRSANSGDTLMLSEFGATDDRAALLGPLDLADSRMLSWQEWHYCGCDDPTTTGSGDKQAIVLDPKKPPTGDNLKTSTLDVLTRPYPQAIAGVPEGWSFDADTKRFFLSFDPRGHVDGSGPFGRGVQSEVAVPKRAYPDGYAADVRGGALLSAPGDPVLRVAACPDSERIEVTVVPSGAAQSSCAKPQPFAGTGKKTRLRVSLKPRRVRVGRRVRVRVTVRAGSRKSPVRGAVVRLGGKKRVTGKRGRAVLRVRFRKTGRRRAVASARGYRRGKATLRVVRR